MEAAAQLTALADPTRRRLFELIRQAPASVRELTDQLPVSQPAVSQHLRVLRDAGLVQVSAHGRRHVHTVDRHGLAELRHWIDALWDDALDAYADAAEAEAARKETL